MAARTEGWRRTTNKKAVRAARADHRSNTIAFKILAKPSDRLASCVLAPNCDFERSESGLVVG